MTTNITHQQELLAEVIGLRRVDGWGSDDPDILNARLALDEELGESIPIPMAAQLLGIEEVALEEWMNDGDLPVLFAIGARQEFPVSTLLTCYEYVSPPGPPGAAEMRDLIVEWRRRAAKVSAATLAFYDVEPSDESHRRAMLIGIGYHRVLAKQLDEAAVAEAKYRLWKWQKEERIDDSYAAAWQRLLALPLPQLRKRISEDSQEMRDLRQNSPLAGMISGRERAKVIFEAYFAAPEGGG